MTTFENFLSHAVQTKHTKNFLKMNNDLNLILFSSNFLLIYKRITGDASFLNRTSNNALLRSKLDTERSKINDN